MSCCLCVKGFISLDLSLSLISRDKIMNKEEEEEACSREHMFDKVVTPSDVGKLNRLVIPKQHAERYFPLDHNSQNKGLLLSFEDIKGNSTSTTWRFRYSYWNSSQSYVMTKGWSRFVKDKSLVAGDIVSFLRDSCNQEKLYIDWRRRPKMMIQDQNHLYNQFSRGSMLMMPRFYSFPHNLDVGYYVRDPTAVIESVPFLMMNQTRAHVASIGGGGGGGGKRLRLFGVDIMESSSSSSSGGCVPRGNVSMGGSFLKMRLVSDDESLVAMENESVIEDHHHHHHFFTKKGKSSLSFDLDK
ncbi:unnamed protein product [Cochlearia groenlandica]